jgi:hypothetical protein
MSATLAITLLVAEFVLALFCIALLVALRECWHGPKEDIRD